MDALFTRAVILTAAFTSLGASYRTPNFVVTTSSPRLAKAIGDHAEQFRKNLAVEWLGRELPRWQSPCPITAHVAPHLGAGGATSFTFRGRQVGNWQMTIQGSEVRILDSVLPHEVTHTIFATHFRQPLPRWADEGACTTVEHPTERARHKRMLIEFLQTNRGIAFSRMFAMKEYPRDMLPLYAQGYSLARYFIEQGGKRKFIEFVGDGLRDENWIRAVQQNYGYQNLAVLQNSWLDWVRRGSPTLLPTPGRPDQPQVLVASNQKRPRPAPNLIYRVSREEAAATTPTKNAPDSAASPSANEFAGTRSSTPPRSLDTNGWRSPGTAPAKSAPQPGQFFAGSTKPFEQQHQAVRQQPPQQPRQRVLEQ